MIKPIQLPIGWRDLSLENLRKLRDDLYDLIDHVDIQIEFINPDEFVDKPISEDVLDLPRSKND